MCSLMSECGAAVASNSSCAITASNITAGTLDLCTVEGVSSGAIVQGILATAGVHMLSCRNFVRHAKGLAAAPPPCLCWSPVTCNISKVCADVHVSCSFLCRPAARPLRV
jgi:hypothetical protein